MAELVYLHTAEIEKIHRINTVSTIKLLQMLYGRIKDSRRFCSGVAGSIAGMVPSPVCSIEPNTKRLTGSSPFSYRTLRL